jgi:AAA domain
MSEFVPEPLPQGWEHWPQNRQQALWVTRKAARAAWENGGIADCVPAPTVEKYEPAPGLVNPLNGGGDADLGGEAPKTPRKRKAKEGDGEKPALRAPPKFPLIAWPDITFEADQEWRVDDVFPRVGLACLYGGPGAVKTFILLDLFLRIARGGLWGGREVAQAPVVYIAAEGSGGIKKRIAGLKHADQGLPADIPFFLITVAPNLGTGDGDLKELIANIEAAGIRPGAIAIDTAAQSIAGADENSKGMAQLVTNGTALANYFSCLVALVHHVPLADDERLRGGTSLIGGLDVSIFSRRAKGTFVATLEVKKMKDGDDEQAFTVNLARIVLGHTKKGREVSTLVVESVEPGAAERGQDKKLPESAADALAALREALDEIGQIPPANSYVPSRTKCVSGEQWKNYMDSRSTLLNPDSKLKAFVRGSARLKKEKLVGVFRAYVWETKQAGQAGQGRTP